MHVEVAAAIRLCHVRRERREAKHLEGELFIVPCDRTIGNAGSDSERFAADVEHHDTDVVHGPSEPDRHEDRMRRRAPRAALEVRCELHHEIADHAGSHLDDEAADDSDGALVR